MQKVRHNKMILELSSPDTWPKSPYIRLQLSGADTFCLGRGRILTGLSFWV